MTSKPTKKEFLRNQYDRVAKKSKPGSGARFAALEKSIAANPKVDNPAAVAATIGRNKYKGRYNALIAKGKGASAA